MSIFLTINDLHNKFFHNFVYDIYENWINYTILGLCCKNCKFQMDLYVGKNSYLFEKQFNFREITKINEFEYAYDALILSCNESIIKNIIE